MNAKISTLFLVKTEKLNSKGQVTKFLRLIVTGKRFEILINLFLFFFGILIIKVLKIVIDYFL